MEIGSRPVPRIRQASLDDARGIAEVHVASWRTTYAGIVPQGFLDTLDLRRREIQWKRTLADAGKNHVFVTEEEAGRVTGFAQGGPEEDGDALYTGELGAIYLLKEVQRKGLGRALFSTVRESLAADGHRAMLAWVISRNPSRGFYEALGGRPVKTRVRPHGGVALEETAFGWADMRPSGGEAFERRQP